MVKTKDVLTKEWLYSPSIYCRHREILGTIGENPLIVIGVNPSTAEPNKLDPTLKSVERIAEANGYDSFIMFNVYSQRATNPDDLDVTCDEEYVSLNNEAFKDILEGFDKPNIWLAYGNLIDKRPYLKECLRQLLDIGTKLDANWYVANLTKKGNPVHPLYLKSDTKLKPILMTELALEEMGVISKNKVLYKGKEIAVNDDNYNGDGYSWIGIFEGHEKVADINYNYLSSSSIRINNIYSFKKRKGYATKLLYYMLSRMKHLDYVEVRLTADDITDGMNYAQFLNFCSNFSYGKDSKKIISMKEKHYND